ncbi:MAG: carboxylesterase [Zetaproteobacteria bacterium CG12_big_fil_rev_8_21_14_0_65_54_13]|nr:MAG: carboxylesterase [Zetaproteobacteria bacterium CG23_combo_of_CG06-09_8_20_14_all_54_7]PIW49188.1 MAG: carboxylesterase [Zetaproteobacteria bacterium CG12_big_fil_rev_8_21_14_0_65_54_13]PIX55454.1 MAG: carboxylesterase [Zetaproteobacteria bacterium CG_4_10_14_3_um_filter_54_28]PJA29228.1 MAG: carboxylesterase [Zetaproteobacteria bacterium CG_4_9_14_3_um_filter_54_145]
MSLQTLPHITIETAPNPVASIIWLHGLGADGHDFEAIVPQLGLPAGLAVRFIFPHAPSMPVTFNGGYIMPAWYDIRQNDLGIEHDAAGIQASHASINMLIEQEIMRGIPANRLILAGFSQGAAMALYSGLRQSNALAGIIALSGYLLMPGDRCDYSQASRATPLFMAHGIDDQVVPFALGDSCARQLKADGYQLEWHSYPMQHSVCQQEISHIGQWISARLQ